jgi:NAD(P)H-hydrate epimerase
VQKIGIDDRSFLEKEPAVRLLEENDLRAGLPRRVDHSNKGTYGRLLLVAGSVNMAGAAILAAKAAYAAGVGLVRIVTPEENRVILQTAVPEAILTTYVDKTWNPDSFTESLSWADAIVCGPGLGLSDTAKCMVEHVLSDADVPVLFDADALNLLATEVSLLERPHGDLVVTPHLKEMSRLSGHAVDYLQSNLIASAMEFACQYNVTCVLKDARTVTAVPYRNVYLNLSGNHGMAVGGSGDVLSGVIGSLLAQGMNAEEASAYGVYLHGTSGDLIREETGARAMTASDLIDGLRAESASLEQE